MAWSDDIKRQLKECGEDVYIDETVRIARPRDVCIGDRTRIGFGAYISCPLHTLSNVQIEPYAVLSGRMAVIMEDWTFIGFHSRVFTTSEDYSGVHGPVNQFWGKNKATEGYVQFKPYSGIASNVTVFPGVTFPEGCTVGADSMVRPSCELLPWGVHFGRPAMAHAGPRDWDTVRRLANDPDFCHVGGMSLSTEPRLAGEFTARDAARGPGVDDGLRSLGKFRGKELLLRDGTAEDEEHFNKWWGSTLLL